VVVWRGRGRKAEPHKAQGSQVAHFLCGTLTSTPDPRKEVPPPFPVSAQGLTELVSVQVGLCVLQGGSGEAWPLLHILSGDAGHRCGPETRKGSLCQDECPPGCGKEGMWSHTLHPGPGGTVEESEGIQAPTPFHVSGAPSS
jgi:hypothetical protein